jgi:hypothetical protein
MKQSAVLLALLISANLHAAPNCSRDELDGAVEGYLAAQRTGDRDALTAAPVTRHFEQQQPITAEASIVNTPLAIDFHRSILDETSRRTFTELEAMVTDEAMGAVVGFVHFGPNALPDTHLFRLENGRIRFVHMTVCAPTGCAFN